MNFNAVLRNVLLPGVVLSAVATALLAGCGSSGTSGNTSGSSAIKAAATSTPIKHVVVIFQENVSFDHYFGTYPTATNPPGEPAFTAKAGTPVVNTLATPLDVNNSFAALAGVNLLTSNPTAANTANGTNAINPFRLDHADAATADQNHHYDAEQKAFDNLAMDLFPATVGKPNTAAPQGLAAPLSTPAVVMGYYDGNTVTAFWNYAQGFAMSDNSFDTTFGPSTPGALNLVSGQTNGVISTNVAATATGTNLDHEISSDGNGGVTIVGDPQPLGDVCTTRDAVALSDKNQNIGDLLNAAQVTWGWFQGGFDLTITNPNGTTGCSRSTTSSVTGVTSGDYIAHHEPFQYYKSTQNLTHARPTSIAKIGYTDQANHQYDLHDFFDAVVAGNFPAVSFLKAPAYQDGHAGYSDPLDEQTFITQVVNFLQNQPDWSSTLVVIAYDDSDGWYDHQASPIVNSSMLSATAANVALTDANGANLTVTGLADWLNGPAVCNTGLQQGKTAPGSALAGASGTVNAQARCGYGPRQPLLVISPYAKPNYVDHTLTDLTSILRFIEDNWLKGQRIGGSYDALAGPITGMLDFTATTPTAKLYLDPSSGQPFACATCP